jgi:hypothetical protein
MEKQTITLTPGQNTLKGKYRSDSDVLVLLDATNGSFSVEVPDCRSIRNVHFNFNRYDEIEANIVTLTTFHNQKIQNEDTQIVYVGSSLSLETDLTNWYVT